MTDRVKQEVFLLHRDVFVVLCLHLSSEGEPGPLLLLSAALLRRAELGCSAQGCGGLRV